MHSLTTTNITNRIPNRIYFSHPVVNACSVHTTPLEWHQHQLSNMNETQFIVGFFCSCSQVTTTCGDSRKFLVPMTFIIISLHPHFWFHKINTQCTKPKNPNWSTIILCNCTNRKKKIYSNIKITYNNNENYIFQPLLPYLLDSSPACIIHPPVCRIYKRPWEVKRRNMKNWHMTP